MAWDEMFAHLTDDEVPQLWARCMKELRDRGLIRSSNNPVADIAERLAAEALNLTLAPAVSQGYDAVDAGGRRYQIKSRRLTAHNKSRQLGVIRKMELREFDFLVAVLFDENLAVLEMWLIPQAVVAEFGKWVPTLNGHRVHAQGGLLADSRVRRVR
jgi:hypothetical protein